MKTLFVSLVCLTLLPLAATAEDWIGKTVFWKDGTKAKIGNQEVAIITSPFPRPSKPSKGNGCGSAGLGSSKPTCCSPARPWSITPTWSNAIPTNRSGGDAARDPRQPRERRPAIADYTQSLKLEPANAAAYNNRGIAYAALGQNDQAIADFDQAIKLDPKRALYYNVRGTIYNKLDHYTSPRRLQPGRHLRIRFRRGLQQPRRRVGHQGGPGSGVRRLQSGHRARRPLRPGVRQSADAWNRQHESNKAINDLNEALSID